MAVVEVGVKQAQAQREDAYFAALFRVDGDLEEVRPIPRGQVRQRAREYADRLLSGELRAYYVSVSGGE